MKSPGIATLYAETPADLCPFCDRPLGRVGKRKMHVECVPLYRMLFKIDRRAKLGRRGARRHAG